MNKKEEKELKDIEDRFLSGVSDNKQAMLIGISKLGFPQRWMSLHKKRLLAERDANFTE